MESGNTFAMTSEYEISFAEKITKLAGVDLVRYANSGAGYRRSPVLVAHGSGIPHLLGQLMISIPYNDEEAVTGQCAFLFTKLFVHNKIERKRVFPPETLELENRKYLLHEAMKFDILGDEISEIRLA
jgi:hypothetical protein